jgi:GxxExxY protein
MSWLVHHSEEPGRGEAAERQGMEGHGGRGGHGETVLRLESTYSQCLEYELDLHQIQFRRQVPLALTYGTLKLGCVYRADLIIENDLLVELKSIERLAPIHYTQMFTYLRLSGVRQALLINFNVRKLTDGVKSFLASSQEPHS